MYFKKKLVKAKLLKRYKRFLSEHMLENGKIVLAHCANPGSMYGLIKKDLNTWLSISDDPNRKTNYSWELACINNAMIGINTHNPNKIIENELYLKTILQLSNYTYFKREVNYGNRSRIDFLLEDKNKNKCYLEIKNVNLSRIKSIAEFPDSITKRGTKHIKELILQKQNGHRSIILFLVQRDDCRYFRFARDLDPIYADTIKQAVSAGVEILCYDCIINTKEIKLNKQIEIIFE